MSSPVVVLTTKEFGQLLSELAKEHKKLMKLSSEVGKLKKGQKFKDKTSGQTYGRKEVNSLSSQYSKRLRGLRSNYVQASKKKKIKRKSTGRKGGFSNPTRVSEAMRGFLTNANLGLVDPRLVQSAQNPTLNSQLSVAQTGVTTRSILTAVFNDYVYQNAAQMKRDPVNKQFLTATPEMTQYFGATFTKLEAQPATVSKKTGKTNPKFDRNHFRYADFQKIVKDNSVATTAAEKAGFEQYRPRLEQEQGLASGTLLVHKAQKLAVEKGMTVEAALAKLQADKARKASQ